MSAIAGIWTPDGRPFRPDACERMLDAQRSYGPDDAKHWRGPGITMGRRLFRLLPEDGFDRGVQQPAGRGLTLVADLRIDNRDEIILDLGERHDRHAQSCDAAILVAALARWGDDALNRIAGDFAFALYDTQARTLTLARDILGQRPLHYYRGDGFFAFATMPKGLHALSEIPYAANEAFVAEFVALLPPAGSSTFFTAIERVEPGHIVTVTQDGIASRRYWEPRPPDGSRMSPALAVEGLRHHMALATQARLRGIRPVVGTQLSGGFDSGAVTATAARLLRGTDRRLAAFTAVPRDGYDGPVPRDRFGDEGPHAAAVAALYDNIEHVLVRSDRASPLDDLDRMFFLFDRPMLNLCNWSWFSRIAAAARDRGINVMLNGQMGNMTISYNGLERLPALLAAGAPLAWAREARRLHANRFMSARGILAQTLGPFLPRPLWRRLAEATGRGARDVLHYSAIRPDVLADLDLPRVALERDLDLSYRPRRDGFAARLWGMRRVDLGNVNKGMLAGWQIDQRDPTADKRLIEYCLALPMEHFLGDGVPRLIGRRAFADRLPPRILDERRKGYQGADWHEGLDAARAEVAVEIERLGACAPVDRTLDTARLKALVANWPADGWERQERVERYRLALLRGIAAGHFLRKASGAN